MFAPEGYLPLQSVLERVYDEIYPRLKARRQEFREHSEQQSGEVPPMFYDDAVYLGAAVSIIGMYDEPVRICSPAGTVLRPTPDLWQPLSRNIKLNVPAVDSPLEDIRNFIVPYIKGYFTFVDHLSWTVSIPDVRGYKSKSLFVTEAILLSARLRPLHGYSLCVPEGSELEKQFASENDAVTLNGHRGRPPIVPAVARILREQFDNSRGDMSWKQLALEVSEELGRSVSVHSVKRAMRQNDAGDAAQNSDTWL